MDPLKSASLQNPGTGRAGEKSTAEDARAVGAEAGREPRSQQTLRPDAAPAPEAVEDERVGLRNAEENAARLRELSRSLRRELEFQVSEDGRTVIDVRDAETGELIRTIPPEEQARVLRALERGDASLLDSEA